MAGGGGYRTRMGIPSFPFRIRPPDNFGRKDFLPVEPHGGLSRKEAAGARARKLSGVEDVNGGHRRAALGVGRLSRRRHSCTEGRPWVRRSSGVSQTS